MKQWTFTIKRIIRHISKSSITWKSQNGICREASCFPDQNSLNEQASRYEKAYPREHIRISKKHFRRSSQGKHKQTNNKQINKNPSHINQNPSQSTYKQTKNPELPWGRSQPQVTSDVSPSTYSYWHLYITTNINIRRFLSMLSRMLLQPCTNGRFGITPVIIRLVKATAVREQTRALAPCLSPGIRFCLKSLPHLLLQ